MSIFWLPFGLKPKAENPEEEGTRYADLYERGVAAAIDVGALYLLLNDLFTYVTMQFYGRADRASLIAAQEAESGGDALRHAWEAGLPQLWLINGGLQIAIIGLFIVGCQLTWNTTPGKWLLGISIRRRDLELPEAWRYVLRFFAYIPSAPLFFWVSFNKKHRGIHDMISGTVVIHTRPRGWYWLQVKRLWRRLRGRDVESGLPIE